jgi:hypothetical protein
MLSTDSVVLVGLFVLGLLVMFLWLEFTLWGMGVQFVMFLLSRWFGACCFLFFDSVLQGCSPVAVVGDFIFYFIFGLLLFFGALYDVQPLHT